MHLLPHWGKPLRPLGTNSPTLVPAEGNLSRYWPPTSSITQTPDYTRPKGQPETCTKHPCNPDCSQEGQLQPAQQVDAGRVS